MVLVALIAGAAAGVYVYVRPKPAPPSPPKTQTTQGEVDQDEVDRLRSLGYVAFSNQSDNEKSGVILKTSRSYPGYNLYTNAGLCSAVLMDESGKVKNFWQLPDDCYRLANATLLDTGDLLVVGTDKGPYVDPEDLSARRFLLKLSWKGELLWKRLIPVHHDVELTPTGQLLTIMIEHRKIPKISTTLPVRDNLIAIASPDGNIQESYSIYDLMKSAPGIASIQEVKGEKEVDLIHANAIEWVRKNQRTDTDPIYSLSNILFCSRHQDTVGIMDWPRKKLLWAWGQGEVSGPHDATMLQNGNILLFDNGLARGWSRVIELDPLSKKIVWEYKTGDKDFFSTARGSNQRLPNGNTLISQSDSGRAIEVTKAGDIVWEFRNPFRSQKGKRAAMVRMVRFERSEIDAIVKRLGEGRLTAPLTAPTGSDESPE